MDLKAAVETQRLLQKGPFSNRRVALAHGKLSSAERAQAMSAFTAGEVDILVATTVVEVGVDVPNATLVVVEQAERFGISQLHQLRGRVGRGIAKSHCLLLYHPPLSEVGKRRLNVLRESNDGFLIADEDLKIRGPGELFGSRQSGTVQFRIADLIRDHHMLGDVAEVSRQMLSNNRTGARAVIDRWILTPEDFSQA